MPLPNSDPGLNPGVDTVAVIFHADDVGMCHGANRAFLELSQRGLVTCGSVMVPCPWFREVATMARAHPELDLGVHLTLTSEWQHYRWGPISTSDPASGLIDDEGYFWRRTPMLRGRIDPAAAETELRAQIERALAAGIDVTHLDTHMGAATIPELVPIYASLGREYRLPVLLPREPASYAALLGLRVDDALQQADLLTTLAGEGMPLVDRFIISPMAEPGQAGTAYRQLLSELAAGLTFFSLHPNAPGDIETINPERAWFRVDEYQLLQDPAFIAFVAHQGIRPLGYRQLRDVMRRE